MQVGSLHGHAGVGKTSVVGLAVQFLSEMCEALRLCLAQLLMCNIKMHQFEVLRQMSSTCIVFLAVGVWSLEWPRFVDNAAWLRILQHPHWYLLAGASLLAAHLLLHQASWAHGAKHKARLVMHSIVFLMPAFLQVQKSKYVHICVQQVLVSILSEDCTKISFRFDHSEKKRLYGWQGAGKGHSCKVLVCMQCLWSCPFFLGLTRSRTRPLLCVNCKQILSRHVHADPGIASRDQNVLITSLCFMNCVSTGGV